MGKLCCESTAVVRVEEEEEDEDNVPTAHNLSLGTEDYMSPRSDFPQSAFHNQGYKDSLKIQLRHEFLTAK